MAPSAYVSVNAGVTGSTASTPSIIQNDYIIVVVGFESSLHTVSTITDSASPGTVFTQEASSDARQDVEIWCGQYTASSGSDAVTVKTAASASYSFRAIFVAGLTSCTPDSSQTNNGNAGSPSVVSFTPVTGDFCEAATSDATGSGASVWTVASPFNSQGYYSDGVPYLQDQLTSGTGWVADSFKGYWDSSFGATTAAFTSSVNSSPLWDEAVACFPTISTGDEMTQGRGFFPRASSINPNLGVEAPYHNEYIVALITLPVTSATSHVTSVTDAQADVYTKVVSSGTRDDVEMWIAHYTGATGGSISQLTFNLNVAEPTVIGDFEVSGISSITAQTATASGTASTASVISFTPDTNDICVATTSFNAGSNPITWTTPANQPFQQISFTQQANGFNNNYFVTAFRADWPSGTSTTATFTPNTTSSPGWDEIVACFPGSVVVPVTCMMSNSAPQATLTLSESSGNGLSPTSVACDGNPHNITVDPSVTLTATEPADGSSSRYRFSGFSATSTDATCAGAASGSCSAFTFTDYYQLQNTYQASPFNPTTWDTGASTVALDGSGSAVCTGCSSQSKALTTAHTNDVILVACQGDMAGATWSVSDAAGLTWNQRGSSFSGAYYIAIFYAISSAALSADSITCHQGISSNFAMIVWGVSGANTGTPFDPNSNLPNTRTTGVAVLSGGCTMTTSNPNDFLFGTVVTGGEGITGQPAGFAAIQTTAGTPSTGASYEVVSSTQSGLSVAWTFGMAHTFSAWCDAIQAAGYVTASGTSLGSAGQTICVTGPPTSGSSAVITCTGWADYNLPVTMGVLSVSPTEQWVPTTLTYTDMTGGAIHTDNYVDQFKVTLRAVPAGQGTTTPSGIVWMNYGTDSISATANAGAAFSSWSSTGTILIAAPSSASTNAAVTGTGTITGEFSTLISDAYGFSESPSVNVLLARAASDTFSFSESVSRFLSATGAALDSFSFSDSVSRSLSLLRSLADTFLFSDSVIGASAFPRVAQDSFSFLESATGNVLLGRSASDTFSFTDLANTMEILQRTGADAFPFSDAVSGSLIFSRATQDAFTFVDSVAANSLFGRSPSDTFAFSDVAARMVTLSQAVGDSFSFADSIARSLQLSGVAQDALNFVESAASNSVFSRAVGDLATFIDIPTAVSGILRTVGDSFPVTDVSARLAQLFAGLSDRFSFSDSLNPTEKIGRAIFVFVGDSFAFLDSASRQASFDRAAFDLVSYADSAARSVALFQSALDNFVFHDVAGRLQSITASVQDSISYLDHVLSSIFSPATTSSTSSTKGGGSSTTSIPFFLFLAFFILLLLLLVLLVRRRRRDEENPPSSA